MQPVVAGEPLTPQRKGAQLTLIWAQAPPIAEHIAPSSASVPSAVHTVAMQASPTRLTHAEAASQTLSQGPPAPQSWCGSVPGIAGEQVPSAPGRAQVTQGASQISPQQTPSTQWPLAHCG